MKVTEMHKKCSVTVKAVTWLVLLNQRFDCIWKVLCKEPKSCLTL